MRYLALKDAYPYIPQAQALVSAHPRSLNTAIHAAEIFGSHRIDEGPAHCIIAVREDDTVPAVLVIKRMHAETLPCYRIDAFVISADPSLNQVAIAGGLLSQAKAVLPRNWALVVSTTAGNKKAYDKAGFSSLPPPPPSWSTQPFS